MSVFTFILMVVVAGYGLRIAYGLVQSLNTGYVRIRRRSGDTVISRDAEPARFWSLWCVGAALVVVALAYLGRQLGML
ncbi:MAG: hypothetical protein JSR47_03485 [Proteobacteria bacterium]|nr:hypothetical protein [Pseudomonadota bacterium]